MSLIIPAILGDSLDDFEQKLHHPLLEKTPWIHIDIMDGSFTGTQCISHPMLAQHLTLPNIELHLMVNDPLPYIEAWQTNPQFKRAIIHLESPCDHTALFIRLQDLGKKIGLALKITTPLETAAPYISKIDRLLLMAIEPGASGRPFAGEIILQKIAACKKLYPETTIAIDGGMNKKTIVLAKNAGAEDFCCASALWQSPNPSQKYEELTAIIASK